MIKKIGVPQCFRCANLLLRYTLLFFLNLEYQAEVLQIWQLFQLSFFNMDMKEQVTKKKIRKKSDKATISDQVQQALV